MKSNNEVITINIYVDGISAKGLPAREMVPFEVLKEEEQYKAVPLLNEMDRKNTRLPAMISFSFVDHCIITERPLREDMLEVIKNLVQELIEQAVIN